MVQKIFYGSTNAKTENATDITNNVQLILIVLVIVVIGFGIYPQPLINLTKNVVITLIP